MTRRDLNVAELDKMFTAARMGDAEPEPDFLKGLQDQAVAAFAEPVARPAPRPSLLSMIGNVLGGWPGMGGLVAATAAGVWIGIAPPTGLENVVGLMAGADAQLGVYETWLGLGSEEWLELEDG